MTVPCVAAGEAGDGVRFSFWLYKNRVNMTVPCVAAGEAGDGVRISCTVKPAVVVYYHGLASLYYDTGRSTLQGR